MIDAYLGQIKSFGYNFEPADWMFCDGRSLPISRYQALFSLLGTTFGGDHQTTFNLPDLRGRIAIGSGQGPGLPNYPQGQKGGVEQVTLTVAQLPAHNHTIKASSDSSVSTPANNFIGPVDDRFKGFDLTPEASLNAAALSKVGSSQPHNNLPPYLVTNWCICVNGIYPSRP